RVGIDADASCPTKEAALKPKWRTAFLAYALTAAKFITTKVSRPVTGRRSHHPHRERYDEHRFREYTWTLLADRALPHRHGVPEADAFPHVDLLEYRFWS